MCLTNLLPVLYTPKMSEYEQGKNLKLNSEGRCKFNTVKQAHRPMKNMTAKNYCSLTDIKRNLQHMLKVVLYNILCLS